MNIKIYWLLDSQYAKQIQNIFIYVAVRQRMIMKITP